MKGWFDRRQQPGRTHIHCGAGGRCGMSSGGRTWPSAGATPSRCPSHTRLRMRRRFARVCGISSLCHMPCLALASAVEQVGESQIRFPPTGAEKPAQDRQRCTGSAGGGSGQECLRLSPATPPSGARTPTPLEHRPQSLMLRLVRLACNLDAPALPRLASTPVSGDSFSSFWSRSISSTPTICGRSATSPPPTTSTTTAAAAAGHVRSSPAPQVSRSRHAPLFMSTRGYSLLQHMLQPASRTLPMLAVSWPSAPFSASATASSASPPSPSSSDIDEPESAPAVSPSTVAQEGVYEFDGDIPQGRIAINQSHHGLCPVSPFG